MKRLVFSVLSFILFYHSEAQVMTSEILWSLGRVNGLELSADGKKVFYSVTRFDQAENKGTSYLFAHNLTSNSTEPYGGGPEKQFYLLQVCGPISVETNLQSQIRSIPMYHCLPMVQK